jgi:hypothetical protein
VIHFESNWKTSRPKISSICNQVLLSLIHAEQGICSVMQVISFIIMNSVFKQSVLCITIHSGWKAVPIFFWGYMHILSKFKTNHKCLKLHSKLISAHRWDMLNVYKIGCWNQMDGKGHFLYKSHTTLLSIMHITYNY